MINSEKVVCVHCGEETELYYAGSPICVRCADDREGKGKRQDSGSLRQSGQASVRDVQTILLVENDAATLVARSLILHCFGYTVLEADSRGDGWRACHEHHGPIHLMLMNAVLEDDSAIEFVTRLQLLHPRICALFLFDESSPEFPDQQRILCESALLQTPFRVDALADAIRGLLDGAKTSAVSSVA